MQSAVVTLNWERLRVLRRARWCYHLSAGVRPVRALEHQVGRTEDLRRRYAPLEAATSEPAAIFLLGEYLLNPFTQARNVSFDQHVLWALDRGTSPNLRVLDAFPGRAPYVFEGGDIPRLSRLARLRDERLHLRVLTDTREATAGLVELVWRGKRYVLPVAGSAEVAVVLTAGGIDGMSPLPADDAVNPEDDELVVRLLVDGQEAAAGRTLILAEGETLQALLPVDRRAGGEQLHILAGSPNGP